MKDNRVERNDHIDGSCFSKNHKSFFLFNNIFIIDLFFLIVGPHHRNMYNLPLKQIDHFVFYRLLCILYLLACIFYSEIFTI
jgi:hypothetical protein